MKHNCILNIRNGDRVKIQGERDGKILDGVYLVIGYRLNTEYDSSTPSTYIELILTATSSDFYEGSRKAAYWNSSFNVSKKSKEDYEKTFHISLYSRNCPDWRAAPGSGFRVNYEKVISIYK